MNRSLTRRLLTAAALAAAACTLSASPALAQGAPDDPAQVPVEMVDGPTEDVGVEAQSGMVGDVPMQEPVLETTPDTTVTVTDVQSDGGLVDEDLIGPTPEMAEIEMTPDEAADSDTGFPFLAAFASAGAVAAAAAGVVALRRSRA